MRTTDKPTPRTRMRIATDRAASRAVAQGLVTEGAMKRLLNAPVLSHAERAQARAIVSGLAADVASSHLSAREVAAAEALNEALTHEIDGAPRAAAARAALDGGAMSEGMFARVTSGTVGIAARIQVLRMAAGAAKELLDLTQAGLGASGPEQMEIARQVPKAQEKARLLSELASSFPRKAMDSAVAKTANSGTTVYVAAVLTAIVLGMVPGLRDHAVSGPHFALKYWTMQASYLIGLPFVIGTSFAVNSALNKVARGT